MQIEIMAVDSKLTKWLEKPDRPRRECLSSASWKNDPLADEPFTKGPSANKLPN